MTGIRFASGLLLCLGMVYFGGGQSWARDCDPPTVTDQLEWATDPATGKATSPSALPNAAGTAYFITADAKLKAGSKYKLDEKGTLQVLVYQVKNGKAVEKTEQKFQDSKQMVAKSTASLNGTLVLGADGKTTEFAGFAPGAGTYAVICSVPLKDENGNAAIGQITGQVTIPGGECPPPCPPAEPEVFTAEDRVPIRFLRRF